MRLLSIEVGVIKNYLRFLLIRLHCHNVNKVQLKVLTITSSSCSLVWFRDDLRLRANPALHAAAQSGKPVICLYILEDGPDAFRQPGGARKWWLDKSLRALSDSLTDINGRLVLRRCGDRTTEDTLLEFVKDNDCSEIYWNRRYAPHEVGKDKSIKSALQDDGRSVHTFNGSLLREPWETKTGNGDCYKVFTPFWNAMRPAYERTHPSGIPDISFADLEIGGNIEDWALHPTMPDWSDGLTDTWRPGEDGAHERLRDFLEHDLNGYKANRDRPDMDSTSRLSAHLAFGEISSQEIWTIVLDHMDRNPGVDGDGWAFLREIAWRDFSYTLLFQSDALHSVNWNSRFDTFPWNRNDAYLLAWQDGQTGYPIVDAGMRQLWETGWMHNRVRMVVGSFLVKHLLQDWREGETWFWDTLVDADWANNPASWQWIAGSGADAAPYFRIFNPMTQGEKFDPNGDYVRRWVPEIADLPTKYLFEPWTAPKEIQRARNVVIGQTYPKPIVEHKRAREAALQAYESTK